MDQGPRALSGVDAHRQRPLSTLTYRSRVVAALTPTDLERLAHAARSRNRAEGVSTLMLFDGERVVQWLEGPDAALNRIWTSVRRDPRHTSVEVLGQSSTPVRLFRDFELKASVVKTGRAGSPGVDPLQGGELARMALDVDLDAGVLRDSALSQSSGMVRVQLLESAARQLGDMWQADLCDEFEVTLGLGRLQALLRRCSGQEANRGSLQGAPNILVAPLPGEPHMLCASLDADTMWRAGWHPQVEFPTGPGDLRAMVADRWFDALDLSLSMAFRRDHWLPRMAQMIGELRSTSLNPRLVVVASGRVFGERPDVASGVGADAACGSASDIDSTVVRALATTMSATHTMH